MSSGVLAVGSPGASRRFTEPATVGGPSDQVGPSLVVIGGREHQLDVVVASADPVDSPPSERSVLTIGAPAFTPELAALAGRRPDVELIDLERLYHGA